MAYNSALLSADVTSTYLHFDNIRNDVTTGKFWDASDGTETKNIQLSHNATNGIISTSSGDILMKPAGGDTFFYDTGGTKTLRVSQDGTNILFHGTHGSFDFYTDAGGVLRVWDSAKTDYISIGHTGTNAEFRTDDGNFDFFLLASKSMRIYERAATTDYLEFYHDGANGQYYNNAGTTYLDNPNHTLALGVTASQSKIQLYDTGASAWKTAVINNGAWSIT